MKNKILILAAFSVAMGCGKHDQTDPVFPPSAAQLISPTQNGACTTGTIISDRESKITFTWDAADNADGYELVVKNLLSHAIQNHPTTDTKMEVALSRSTPFSWYIVSTSSKTNDTARSGTWKFYNPGVGIVTYAPFPADLTSPEFAQSVTTSTGTVGLKWTASDADNDIVGYDVYFDTSSTPALLKSGIKDMFLNDVEIKSGNTYYWKIVVKDSNGNTSTSDMSQFTVK